MRSWSKTNWLICLDLVWELVWKGIALWRAGKNGHKVWFIAILIFNTIGILPIVYIFGFSKKRGITKGDKNDATNR
ncbi:DUF5652 family protein [Chloroflexota bacterium]